MEKNLSLFLKKVSIYNQGKRLILKNPANTGRIRLLLDMFPDAQFIHIIRNPYEVYYSMMRFMKVIIAKYCVQNPPQDLLNEMMELYNEIYAKYLQERTLIPQENLIEVRYEDLLQDPFDIINQVYDGFQLEGYQKNQRRIKEFIAAQKKTKISSYTMDEDVKEMIYKKWKKTFDAFEYSA